jgi:flagellin
MPIVVNTNASATAASYNLNKANNALRKSLARLSSGNRITQPAEDAGGLAVAYKLDATMKRTEAVLNNHQNALSYLQVQDGVLSTMGSIVNRMAELKTMSMDVTKNNSDNENYSKEFRELQSQLSQLRLEKFNGISLFSDAAADTSTNSNASASFSFVDETNNSSSVTYRTHSRTLNTHPSGLDADGSISLNVVNLQWMLGLDGTANSDFTDDNLGGLTANSNNAAGGGITDGIFSDITDVSIYQFTHVIEKIADARAENGAEQQRINQSYELHQTNLVNLEAAHGRIMDADIALESTRFAKNNVLVQASASMTAQANQLSSIALTLLQ